MIRRWFFRFGCGFLVLAAVLVFTGPAWAGGWAVATLDSLPQGVQAGQPVPVGFTVRQHGRTPWTDGLVEIRLEHLESGQNLLVPAELDDPTTGHYTVSLTFPIEGSWRWGISSGLLPTVQWMPDLVVSPVMGSVGSSAPSVSTSRFPLAAGLVGAGVLAIAFLLGLRRRLPALVRAGLVLGTAALLVVAVLVAAPGLRDRVQAQAVPQALPAQAQLGHDLFLAKGCEVCHRNDRVEVNSETTLDGVGPDLSVYRNDPDFLHAWLKDPKSVRPASGMPNLELKLVEIEALIAFLNS